MLEKSLDWNYFECLSENDKKKILYEYHILLEQPLKLKSIIEN